MPELIPAVPGSPEWLAARRQGVTAIDIVTILGLSSWDSPYSLYWRKLGQIPEVPDNDRFRLGRELEPYVVARWREGRDSELVIDGGLFRSDARPWQMATLDRGIAPDRLPLEVKTWADADKSSWASGPPATVRAQVLWQMDVMDVAVGHVGVVFLPSGEFRSYALEHDPVEHGPNGYKVEHDPDKDKCGVCIDLGVMQQAGREFMWRLENFQAPDPDASAATLAAVKSRFARQPDKEVAVPWLAFDQWDLSKREVDRATEQARKYESELRELIGEASVITVDGQPVARRVVFNAEVKAHTRHMDYLKRIGGKSDD